MRLSPILIAGVAGMCAACATDGGSSPLNHEPPLPFPAAVTIDPRLDARIILPAGPSYDNQISVRVQITSALTDTAFSGVCAAAVDAHSLHDDKWRNVSPAEVTCTLQLVSFLPGVARTIWATADQRKLRAVAGGRGRTAVIRVRHIVGTRTSTQYGVQSAEERIIAP